MPINKFCPLRASANSEQGFGLCEGERCMWYAVDEGHPLCAVAGIAVGLRDIKETISAASRQ